LIHIEDKNMTTTPYSAEQIDALLEACIEYRNDNDQYFAVANITGRGNVVTNAETTKEMMDWVAENHSSLLVFAGLGLDGVPYYRLGWDAKQVMSGGGFSKYLAQKQRKEFVTQTKDWLPIVASIAAVVVSVFAWQEPKDNDKAFAEVNKKIEHIETRLEQQKNISADLATVLADIRRDVKNSTVTQPEPIQNKKR